jgi:hypothetical protein
MKRPPVHNILAGCCAALFAISAHAQITFSFDYQNPGVGFNDATSGAARQAALQDAANSLAAYFVVSTPVTLTFTVNSENNSGSSTLASAGSSLISDGAGFFRTVVQNKIISGTDSNGSTTDGTINWNWAHSWNITSSVGSSDYDFKSTAMHELLHAFGVLSYVGASGTNTGTNWTTFDQFLTTSAGAGSPLIDHTTFAWIGPNSVLTGGGTPPSYSTSGMFFSGTNSLAANSNNPIPIYSPSTWESGSSGSHTADNYFTGANQLMMNAATNTGAGIRTLSLIEQGMLADMGYTLTAVPEPSTYALFFGVSAIGAVWVRRRRRS